MGAPALQRWSAPDGTPLAMRPVVPGDAPAIAEGFRRLSPAARYQRFFSHMRELPGGLLHRLTHPDPQRECALLVLAREESGERLVAVGRHAIDEGGDSCEFALVVADERQRSGIGRRLLEALVEDAEGRGLKAIRGLVRAENHAMISLGRSLGFRLRDSSEGPSVRLLHLDLPRRRMPP